MVFHEYEEAKQLQYMNGFISNSSLLPNVVSCWDKVAVSVSRQEPAPLLHS